MNRSTGRVRVSTSAFSLGVANSRPRPLHALDTEPQRPVVRAFVFHREPAPIPVAISARSTGVRSTSPAPNSQNSPWSSPFRWTWPTTGWTVSSARHAADAGALEVDRVEIHPDDWAGRPVPGCSRQTSGWSDAPSWFSNMKAHVGMPVRQPPQIRADGLERALRVVLELQPAEEQAQLRGAELAGDVDLPRHRPIGLARSAAPPGRSRTIRPTPPRRETAGRGRSTTASTDTPSSRMWCRFRSRSRRPSREKSSSVGSSGSRLCEVVDARTRGCASPITPAEIPAPSDRRS